MGIIAGSRLRGFNANDFIIEVDSGSNRDFLISTSGSGYLYDVLTSDGQSISGNTGDLNITFPSFNTNYVIYIRGVFPQFFEATRRLLDIRNFGIYGNNSTSQLRAFSTVGNLEITANDLPNLQNVTNFKFFLRSAGLISCPLFDTSSGTNFYDAFSGNLFDTFPLIDTSNGTYFRGTWAYNHNLNNFPLLDVKKATNMQYCWVNNFSLSNFPSNFFDGCNNTNFDGTFQGTNLTQQSIDGILVSINSNTTSNGIFEQSGGSAPSTTGEAAITAMRNRGWTVSVTGGF
jgi:hypothetical protein